MNDPQDRLSADLARAAAALKVPAPTPLPPDFAEGIVQMAADRTAPATATPARPAGRLTQLVAGGFRRQARMVRPALYWARVAVLCVISGALSAWWGTHRPPIHEAVMVQFSVTAPEARSVFVAGDFNNWDPAEIKLHSRAGSGRWQALVPMTPGLYQYMFVIDGQLWMADPQAAESIDDGFGRHNSLLRISSPPSVATDDYL